jgi:beta-glucanase (GH16 family)
MRIGSEIRVLLFMFLHLASTGGDFATKNKFLYSNGTADLKVVPGDSAGVVTAFYGSECSLFIAIAL